MEINKKRDENGFRNEGRGKQRRKTKIEEEIMI